MDVEHERSLVAWANTFESSDETACAARSFADFTSGELLVQIARAIVGYNDDSDSDKCADKRNINSVSGWAGVFSHMKTVGLLEQDAEIPGAEADEEKLTLAVTCLEALLRHTVGEQCVDRETFIRQIMSLDASAQTTLRYIIVGHSNDGGNSEACSPSRESAFEGSVLGSPMPSTYSLDSPSFDRSVVGCGDGGDLSTFKNLLSPQEGEDAREARSAGSLGGEDHAAPVGPKRRQARLNLDMETGKDAASVAASAGSLPVVVGGGPTFLTAAEVAHLQVEIAGLRTQLNETEIEHGRAIGAVEAQRDAGTVREAEKSEELRKVRQAAERAACSGEDEVIAAENVIRARHEGEVSSLQERVCKAEERVMALEPLEDEVMRLRDEVDILRPAEAKLSKVEENLSRCRERIEELSDLPAQLKREEDAHAQVLDRCLAMETEVAQIPQLRRQLDGYRRSRTDMEVTHREQSRELKLAQEEVSRLAQEVQTLADGSGAVRNEHQKLQEELTRRAMAEKDEEGGSGIGQGVSELNPVLSEELARLRTQNEQLVAKVDYNTVETIEDLERRADDSNRLADSFHEQLASERNLRSTAEASLADALARIDEIEAELAALHEEHKASVARLESDAAAAASEATTALATAAREGRDAVSAAEKAAAETLDAERKAGIERVDGVEKENKYKVEGLREEMRGAVDGAERARMAVEEERGRERGEFDNAIRDLKVSIAREEERVKAEMARIEGERGEERRGAEEELGKRREEAARDRLEAAEGTARAKKEFEGCLEGVKTEFEGRLKLAGEEAAKGVAAERERTKREEEGRAEESSRKDEALRQVRGLEEELSAGKRAALSAIERLETNARELRKETAWMHQQTQTDHDAQMAALNGEFDTYRGTHTVDDASFNKDMDLWEHELANQKKLVGHLQVQLDALNKDKRRLEREKTYYWGQAEELRISAGAGGRADPTRDADHAQLVEQTKELVEENRELKQRLQEADGGAAAGGVGTRSGARWRSSGVAAMRAEHESEVTALKEEKQDMLIKYHATASKLHEQERRCLELTESTEDVQTQLVKLQLAYRRQERKLADSATVPGASATHNSSTQKENQHRSSATRSSKRLHTSHAKSRVKVSSTKSGISAEEGVSKYVAVAQSSEGGDARNGRALRSLTGRRQDDGDVSRVPKVEAVEDREEGTPPECQQS